MVSRFRRTATLNNSISPSTSCVGDGEGEKVSEKDGDGDGETAVYKNKSSNVIQIIKYIINVYLCSNY